MAVSFPIAQSPKMDIVPASLPQPSSSLYPDQISLMLLDTLQNNQFDASAFNKILTRYSTTNNVRQSKEARVNSKDSPVDSSNAVVKSVFSILKEYPELSTTQFNQTDQSFSDLLSNNEHAIDEPFANMPYPLLQNTFGSVLSTSERPELNYLVESNLVKLIHSGGDRVPASQQLNPSTNIPETEVTSIPFVTSTASPTTLISTDIKSVAVENTIESSDWQVVTSTELTKPQSSTEILAVDDESDIPVNPVEYIGIISLLNTFLSYFGSSVTSAVYFLDCISGGLLTIIVSGLLMIYNVMVAMYSMYFGEPVTRGFDMDYFWEYRRDSHKSCGVGNAIIFARLVTFNTIFTGIPAI